MSEQAELNFRARDDLAGYMRALNEAESSVGEFVNDQALEANQDRDTRSASDNQILTIWYALNDRLRTLKQGIADERFETSQTTLWGNSVWDRGMRQHLEQNEPARTEATILYGGMVRSRCDLLAEYLESEFPAQEAFDQLKGQYEFLIKSTEDDYKLALAFDVKLGDYDFGRNAFDVVSAFPANGSYFSFRKAETSNGNVTISRSDKKTCRGLDPHPSKSGTRTPATLQINYNLKLANASSALTQPLAMPSEQAEKLIEAYRQRDIQNRSIFAIAYFDAPSWQSNGQLGDGRVSINGSANLAHVEFYAYPDRLDAQSLEQIPYFLTSLLTSRADRPGGKFNGDDLITINRVKLPINPPIKTISFR